MSETTSSPTNLTLLRGGKNTELLNLPETVDTQIEALFEEFPSRTEELLSLFEVELKPYLPTSLLLRSERKSGKAPEGTKYINAFNKYREILDTLGIIDPNQIERAVAMHRTFISEKYTQDQLIVLLGKIQNSHNTRPLGGA